MTIPHVDDPELTDVFTWLSSRKNFVTIVAEAIRQAIDDVLDGPRTGRFDLSGKDVEKVEKTYVGTRIELLIISALGLSRGETLDMRIRDVEVDIKTTVTGSWMIPHEAVGRLCLVIQSDDRAGTFGVGLIRTGLDQLTEGSNQDGKRSISAEGKRAIKWFGGSDRHMLPPNFLLRLDPHTRAKVLEGRSGQIRVRETFRTCLETPIPRTGVATIARQLDPMKRVRDARKALATEGIYVLSSHRDRAHIRQFLVNEPPGQYFVSTRKAKDKSQPPAHSSQRQ